MKQFDIIIVGAGAAGLSAAAAAIKRNKSVAILDMGNAPARKVAVSGGGKCNITNDAVGADRYWGENPNFVRSAISRVTPANIRNWARSHGLELYEKTPGRYFCKDGADAVVRALIDDARGATFLTNVQVEKIIKVNNMFHVNNLWAKSVVLATGGCPSQFWGCLIMDTKSQKRSDIKSCHHDRHCAQSISQVFHNLWQEYH